MTGRWLTAAVAAAVLAGGCATGGEATRAEANRDPGAYLPLQVGNSWTYERRYLGEKGEHRVEIVGEENGFFLDNTGRALAVDAYGIRDRERYLLRHPIEAGREWTTVVSVSSMERYKILDVGFTCEVPAGKFKDCVRVEAKNRIDKEKTMVNQITFAPGVGMVRFQLSLQTPHKEIPQGEIVLKSYEAKASLSP